MTDLERLRRVLGVSAGAGEPEIRTAYLQKVKDHPPDRDAATFQRVREAYETLRDPRRKGELLLDAVDPGAPFVSLLEEHPARNFVGPDAWIQTMRTTRGRGPRGQTG